MTIYASVIYQVQCVVVRTVLYTYWLTSAALFGMAVAIETAKHRMTHAPWHPGAPVSRPLVWIGHVFIRRTLPAVIIAYHQGSKRILE